MGDRGGGDNGRRVGGRRGGVKDEREELERANGKVEGSGGGS